MFLEVEHQAGRYAITLTNDGKPPASPIIEGGGLLALKKSITQAGGTWQISHTPHFSLSFTLPLHLPQKGKKDD